MVLVESVSSEMGPELDCMTIVHSCIFNVLRLSLH